MAIKARNRLTALKYSTPNLWFAITFRLWSLALVALAVATILTTYANELTLSYAAGEGTARTNPLTLVAILLSVTAMALQRPLMPPSAKERGVWFAVLALCACFPVSASLAAFLPETLSVGMMGWNTALTLTLIAGGQLYKSDMPVLATSLHALAFLPPMVGMNGHLSNTTEFHGAMSVSTIIALFGLWGAGLVRFVRHRFVRAIFSIGAASRLIRAQLASLLILDLLMILSVRYGWHEAETYAPMLITLETIATWIIVVVFSFKLVELLQESARAERLLLGETKTDAMTGLASRRAAMDDYIATVKHMPIGVLLVDIDNFKEVNDAHGHLVGDQAIIDVAGALRRSCKITDTVARWGGEEFLILLRNTPIEELPRRGAAILKAVSDLPPPGAAPLTVSIGASYAPAAPLLKSLETVLSAADAALYKAKQGGRNRMHMDAKLKFVSATPIRNPADTCPDVLTAREG